MQIRNILCTANKSQYFQDWCHTEEEVIQFLLIMGEYLPYHSYGEGGIFESNNLNEKAVISELTALKISLALPVTHSMALNTPQSSASSSVKRGDEYSLVFDCRDDARLN